MYLSVDYSLTSPAICIQGEEHCFHQSEFHYLTDKKKLIGKLYQNITGWEHKEWKTDEQRYENIALWVFKCVGEARLTQLTKIFIEGYSMGSKGKVFNIAENTGLLKHLIYKKKIPFELIAPTKVKQDFFGKGNATKDHMLEEFIGRTGVNLKTIYGQDRKLGSPETDLVDAWAICLSGRKITKTTLLTNL